MMIGINVEPVELSGDPKRVIRAEDIRAHAINHIWYVGHDVYMAINNQRSSTWWIDHEDMINERIAKAKAKRGEQ